MSSRPNYPYQALHRSLWYRTQETPPRKPTSTELRDFARAGGLISYGADLVDAYRLTGVYVRQILHGAKPAELPVQQSTKIEMVINLKTAKALGVTVPLPLLGRADEVIE
ncbi:MAG: ABC transporter substrate binding protein [Xanthobacteraceae bacterium]